MTSRVARLLGRALVDVLDEVRDATPVYGSGAFCNCTNRQVAEQLSAHPCTAVWHLRHLEHFHDRNRVEHAAFDGCLEPQSGGGAAPRADQARAGTRSLLAGPGAWRVR